MHKDKQTALDDRWERVQHKWASVAVDKHAVGNFVVVADRMPFGPAVLHTVGDPCCLNNLCCYCCCAL